MCRSLIFNVTGERPVSTLLEKLKVRILDIAKNQLPRYTPQVHVQWIFRSGEGQGEMHAVDHR